MTVDHDGQSFTQLQSRNESMYDSNAYGGSRKVKPLVTPPAELAKPQGEIIINTKSMHETANNKRSRNNNLFSSDEDCRSPSHQNQLAHTQKSKPKDNSLLRDNAKDRVAILAGMNDKNSNGSKQAPMRSGTKLPKDLT